MEEAEVKEDPVIALYISSILGTLWWFVAMFSYAPNNYGLTTGVNVAQWPI